MPRKSRISQALSLLLPVGVLGASALLATAQASTTPSSDALAQPQSAHTGVAARLQAIRDSAGSPDTLAGDDISAEEKILLAQWLNIGGGGGGLGWRNGGWGNGGWHNGGWGNGGWHNWGNGGNPGWHNWGNGWHNWGNGGWHNFWHNW